MTGPVLGFGPNDLEGVTTPHSDALVIKLLLLTLMQAVPLISYTGQLLKKWALVEDLQPMATSLFGFLGHKVQSLGQIKLPLSLGIEPRRKTILATFIIVDTPSSYNVILGCLVLSALQAVASPYHRKIKFSVGNEVGEVRGD